MQTRNQWKRPRDWKVVAGVAAAATLGISGLALASPDDGDVPDSITLEEQSGVTDVSIPDTLPPVTVVDLTDDSDLDSPFDDSPAGQETTDSPDNSPPGPTTTAADSPDDSPAGPSTTVADDSPDDSPAGPSATVADDSPDDSPAPPATTAPDDSPDSPDDSPAPPSGGGDDSPDDSGSGDSGDS